MRTHNKKIILQLMFTILSCLLLLTVAGAYAADEKERILNIVYTGAVHGELEPCGCSPKTDYGGLPRRSRYLDGKLASLHPYLLIEAGNFLGEDNPQGRLKSETMVEALMRMKYDVAAELTGERLYPREFILSLFKHDSLLLLSSRSQGKESVHLLRGGVKVNVSIDPDISFMEKGINILLADKSVDDLSNLKNGWDIIILASGKILEEPLEIGGAIVVSGYPRGQRVGILSIYLDGKGNIVKYRNRWQMLGVSVGKDREMELLLEEYNKKVALFYNGLIKNGVQRRDRYVGVKGCSFCHTPMTESWKKTMHAGAWQALEQVGRSHDPECIVCHTTGYSQGGFVSIGVTPELAGVQCEACHGDGTEHATDFSSSMKKVKPTICSACHIKEKSPDFDYSIYLEKIKH